ncbi:hypothetical protein SOQ14_02010 [Erythrobacter sp. T5W1-R]|uniref:hypothetical protein n=1 Tax=Erythrobacter sp. T5W1-R TaxID=3101752 RepID=UPI002AFF7989|nr:hypothetical protein [Erythrobacter sp. T5W1-R]MEA1617682.1 hypothetical protein [Erythrobacter sp. T5W1-R]
MENSWITAQEFQVGLQNAGSNATQDQIERWRRNGLLPRPKQTGLGRGRGSFIKVPAISIAQTVEIERLFAIRRKLDWVGWQLWLEGFPVSDQHWRGPLEIAQSRLLEAQAAAGQFDFVQIDEAPDPEAIKQAIVAALRSTALDGQLTKISAELVETLAGFLQEMITGNFQGFSPDSASRPNANERDAVLSAMGVKSKSAQTIAHFAGSIEIELQQISKAFSVISSKNAITEPSIEARQGLRYAIEIGSYLYRNSKALTGGKSLKVLSRIAANPSITLQAIMLLLWAEYREISKTMLPFFQIVEMRRQVPKLPQIPH